jgi:hypothetical protein
MAAARCWHRCFSTYGNSANAHPPARWLTTSAPRPLPAGRVSFFGRAKSEPGIRTLTRRSKTSVGLSLTGRGYMTLPQNPERKRVRAISLSEYRVQGSPLPKEVRNPRRVPHLNWWPLPRLAHHTAASRSTAFSTFARRSSPVFANEENCSAVVVIPARA